MNAKPLVVITTRLPPAICGIGTYSWRLREHWPNESRSIEFFTVDPGASPRGDRVVSFANRADDLLTELRRIASADVLLHYAGRAFHRYGFPFWLSRVLKTWKREKPESRLTVFFHELPGPLPITSRHYWLGELNKRVVRRLADIADVLITNTEHHEKALRKISGRADIHLVPIGSNIEPAAANSDQPRNRTEFVLFGLPFGRVQTRQLFASHVDRWRAAGRLTKLHVIGPEANDPDAENHGVLEPVEISRLLQSAGFCLTNASEATWSKSTTFMAAAAHGCVPVIAGARRNEAPLSYAVAADEINSISDDEVTERRAQLARWYGENADWGVTARKIAALVSPA
ncbi:MAG: hypothetical protein ACJ8HQ_07000 [Chthoniobacterales bacterium]